LLCAWHTRCSLYLTQQPSSYGRWLYHDYTQSLLISWGTWKCGLGLCQMGVKHPGGIIKNLVGIIMAGVLGIYGLIVAIVISGGVGSPNKDTVHNMYSQYTGWAHLAAGLCCGLCNLAAGGATGIAGEVGILATGLRAELNHAKANKMSGMNGGDIVDEGDAGKLYIGSVTILSFSGAIGLYGFILALIITSSNDYPCDFA
jgi:V-type H+-transporting ATPase proteolipid subunit